MSDARRATPSVGSILERPDVRALQGHHPRSVVTDAVRDLLADIRDGAPLPANDAAWAHEIAVRIERYTLPSLRAAINATGVVLHTNLGRAPLAASALERVAEVARGASTLEYDVGSGTRGSRHVHCAALLRELTGAEDAMVVNNCAAGLVLSLQALASGRETLVSRGELVEIGGSFRVPEIMAMSGTTLVEVGTTNRTQVQDYRRALSPRTGAIVKVHRSNFAIEGFVADASVRELVPVAAEAGVPLVHDFGSGLMLDLSRFGLGGEPTVRDAVTVGATLVVMSGDKLLGGPQAGIILGAAAAIGALRKHPLARALRVDKLTLAALEATLALYRDEADALREIPTLAMLTATAESLRERAQAIAKAVGYDALAIEHSEATVGGGAFPTARIDSVALTLPDVSLEPRLRAGRVPVVGRIAYGRLWLDLRAVDPHDDAQLARLIREALA